MLMYSLSLSLSLLQDS